jgi:hypothetical protein
MAVGARVAIAALMASRHRNTATAAMKAIESAASQGLPNRILMRF